MTAQSSSEQRLKERHSLISSKRECKEDTVSRRPKKTLRGSEEKTISKKSITKKNGSSKFSLHQKSQHRSLPLIKKNDHKQANHQKKHVHSIKKLQQKLHPSLYHNNIIGIPLQDYTTAEHSDILLHPRPTSFAAPSLSQQPEEYSDYLILLRFMSAVSPESEDLMKFTTWTFDDLLQCVVLPPNSHTVPNFIAPKELNDTRIDNSEQKQMLELQDQDQEMVENQLNLNEVKLQEDNKCDDNDDDDDDDKVSRQSYTTSEIQSSMTPFCFTLLSRLLSFCGRRLPPIKQVGDALSQHALERCLGRMLRDNPIERLCLWWDRKGVNVFYPESSMNENQCRHWNELTPLDRCRVMKFLLGAAMNSSARLSDVVTRNVDKSSRLGVIDHRTYWLFTNAQNPKDLRLYVESLQHFQLIASAVESLVDITKQFEAQDPCSSVAIALKDRVQSILSLEKALIRRERQLRAVFSLRHDAQSFMAENLPSRRSTPKTLPLPSEKETEGRSIRAAARAANRKLTLMMADEEDSNTSQSFPVVEDKVERRSKRIRDSKALAAIKEEHHKVLKNSATRNWHRYATRRHPAVEFESYEDLQEAQGDSLQNQENNLWSREETNIDLAPSDFVERIEGSTAIMTETEDMTKQRDITEIADLTEMADMKEIVELTETALGIKEIAPAQETKSRELSEAQKQETVSVDVKVISNPTIQQENLNNVEANSRTDIITSEVNAIR